MHPICADEGKDGCFWIPLYYSTIIETAPKPYCLEVTRLREEYLGLAAATEEANIVLCMEVLFGSTGISDVTRLHILGVLQHKVPWLFFMRDNKGEFALQIAIRQMCSPAMLRF
jgi:hypothetical protein